MLEQSRSTRRVLLAGVLLAVGLTASALAQKTDEDRVEFGHNITVAPGQTSGDISCFNCSVYVGGKVNGDIAVFGGRVIVEGSVRSDVAVFWGNVRVEDGGQVGGDVAVFGGVVKRAPTATIGGSVATFGRGWVLVPVLIMVAIVWFIVALIVWLVTRNRRAPAPGQPVRQV
jgi:hypothetical protein